MAKPAFHPNAYLSQTRNIRRGLVARTKLLRALEENSTTAGMLTKQTALNYKVVVHHLRLLEAEKIVSRKVGKKPRCWELTGAGQQRLRSA
jgi:DNA-binding HxlR family transcriptional regulator